MLFKPKIVFALVLLGMCLASLNEVYGKPALSLDQGVDVGTVPFEPSANRIHRGSCSNLKYGCDNGFCWSRCQSDQSVSEGRSSSESRTLTGCYSNSQCANHYANQHKDQINNLNQLWRHFDHADLFGHLNRFNHSNLFDHRNLFDIISNQFDHLHSTDCSNTLYGCEDGYCWSECGSAAQAHASDTSSSSSSATRSSSSSRRYTGCNTKEECAGNIYIVN